MTRRIWSSTPGDSDLVYSDGAASSLQGSIGPNELVQNPPYKARQVLRIILLERQRDRRRTN